MTVSQEADQATVLLVEDNPADQDLTRRALNAGGIQCNLRVAADGEEALNYVFRREEYSQAGAAPRPQLVMLDLNMPRVDGWDVLRRMKAAPDLDTIPVIVLTTSGHEQDVMSSYKLGCSSYVQKPMDVSVFMCALQQLLDYWLNLVILP